MNKRIAKKKAKAILAQQKPVISAKEIKAISRARLIESLRGPQMYEGKLKHNADYYAAIKKYHDYVNRGLIKESSNLDKYNTADAFYETLSKGEQTDVMMVSIEKAAKLEAESLERIRQEESGEYYAKMYPGLV